jgi:hypothetical protein
MAVEYSVGTAVEYSVGTAVEYSVGKVVEYSVGKVVEYSVGEAVEPSVGKVEIKLIFRIVDVVARMAKLPSGATEEPTAPEKVAPVPVPSTSEHTPALPVRVVTTAVEMIIERKMQLLLSATIA